MKDFRHHHAAHCESGTVSALLRHQGLNLSEPMVFGIGGGLFFLHLSIVKLAGIPLTSYREAPRAIIKNIEKRLGVRWRSERYRSADRAMRSLDEFLDRGQPVGLQTGIYWLTYFPIDMRFHFNGHNIVAFGRDGADYLVSDPVLEVPVTCLADDLRRARFAKGPFAPRGLTYYPEFVPQNPDLRAAAADAIRKTAKRMTEIPMPFLGIRGIRSLAKKLERWPEKLGREKARKWVSSVVRMQEEIGTGGAGFRFMYAAFLQEASELLARPVLRDIAEDLTRTGDRWRDFAVQGALFVEGRDSDDGAYTRLAAILRECADREQEIFDRLKAAT